MRIVFNYVFLDDELRVNLGWLNSSFSVYLYLCENVTRDLDGELALRGVSLAHSITLVPRSIVKTPLQLVQGATHFKLYGHKVTKVKNPGILLGMLITGMRQISDFLSTTRTEIEKGEKYYLVAVGTRPGNTQNCKPLKLTDMRNGNLWALVKNTKLVLSLT